jgi:hypothetical protein
MKKFKNLQIPSNSYIIFQMGKPLIPAQRRERIQEYLAVHQIVRTTDLMDLLEHLKQLFAVTLNGWSKKESWNAHMGARF